MPYLHWTQEETLFCGAARRRKRWNKEHDEILLCRLKKKRDAFKRLFFSGSE
jgi:hypothetical protein